MEIPPLLLLLKLKLTPLALPLRLLLLLLMLLLLRLALDPHHLHPLLRPLLQTVCLLRQQAY